MGVCATYFMDLLSGFLANRKLIYPIISPEAIGRWFLYIFRGKLIHKDINKSSKLKNEKLWSVISHYLIGVVLAGVYLLLESNLPIIREHIWMSLLFGTATVFLPWLWLLPSIGIGFMASKSLNRSQVIRTNLINHSNFGLGLLIWIVLLHRYFKTIHISSPRKKFE